MCRAASFRVEDSFASASHWLLTRTAFSPWRGCSLVPGGGEDRYGRGGLSEGRLSCRPPRVYGGVGRVPPAGPLLERQDVQQQPRGHVICEHDPPGLVVAGELDAVHPGVVGVQHHRVPQARDRGQRPQYEAVAPDGHLGAGDRACRHQRLPALTLEWLDGRGLFKPLGEGELAYSSGMLGEQVAEVWRDLTVNAHPMVEGVVPEPRVPHRDDMLVVFDEP